MVDAATSSLLSSQVIDGVVTLAALVGVIWLAIGRPKVHRPNLPKGQKRSTRLTHHVIAAGVVAGSLIYLRHILLTIVIVLVASIAAILFLKWTIRWERRRVSSNREERFIDRSGEE